MKLPWPSLTPTLMAATAGASLVAGLFLGWTLWHPRGAAVETAAPAVIQADSSLILARAPDRHAAPGMIVPAGGTVERIIHLIVQGPAPVAAAMSNAESAIPAPPAADLSVVTCPPAHIDLTIERERDGSHRVIAKSPGGHVLSGVDIPVTHTAPSRVLRWGVGPAYDFSANAYGAALTRDAGPFRVVGLASYRPPNVGAGRPGGVGGAVAILLRF